MAKNTIPWGTKFCWKQTTPITLLTWRDPYCWTTHHGFTVNQEDGHERIQPGLFNMKYGEGNSKKAEIMLWYNTITPSSLELVWVLASSSRNTRESWRKLTLLLLIMLLLVVTGLSSLPRTYHHSPAQASCRFSLPTRTRPSWQLVHDSAVIYRKAISFSVTIIQV